MNITVRIGLGSSGSRQTLRVFGPESVLRRTSGAHFVSHKHGLRPHPPGAPVFFVPPVTGSPRAELWAGDWGHGDERPSRWPRRKSRPQADVSHRDAAGREHCGGVHGRGRGGGYGVTEPGPPGGGRLQEQEQELGSGEREGRSDSSGTSEGGERCLVQDCFHLLPTLREKGAVITPFCRCENRHLQ